MAFYPKDPRIKSVLDRLYTNGACETDYEIAKQLSKYKQIREIRRREELYIGMDRKMGKSVLWAKKPLKKKGDGFLL